MLKLILHCDKCKKEILPNTVMIFVGKMLEIKTSMPSKELLTPLKLPQRGGPVFLEEILETKFHLCPSCYIEFKAFLEQGK
ncbi:MAG: hypothetical protein DDT18_01162 [Actinobacteria bacterium]|nr:hypothetical protein [Actinomycetota bacterium]